MTPRKPRIPQYRVTESMIIARNWHRRQAPFFRVEETAKTFFGMSASWLRLKMAATPDHPLTWFVRDGRPMEFRRADPAKPDSARIFTLADIEPMVASLLELGGIDSVRAVKILDIVYAMAALYGLFDQPSGEPGDDPDADNLGQAADSARDGS